VDRCENVYVSGWGGGINTIYNTNQSTVGLTVTSDAIKNTTDGQDLYFFVLEKNATSQLYGSFLVRMEDLLVNMLMVEQVASTKME
jgi:hypothetical protein